LRVLPLGEPLSDHRSFSGHSRRRGRVLGHPRPNALHRESDPGPARRVL